MSDAVADSTPFRVKNMTFKLRPGNDHDRGRTLRRKVGKTGGSVKNDAESVAFGAENGPIDPKFQFIIDQWDNLPKPVKAGILAMVRAS